MKRIQEYQMLLNASKIPYLEKKKSYLCESNCNSPENVAEIMEKCFQMSNLPEEHVYAIALNTRSSIIGVFEISRGTCCCKLAFSQRNFDSNAYRWSNPFSYLPQSSKRTLATIKI